MSEIYDCIVVGAGIAGLTASLYLARQGLKIIVIGKDLGGQLKLASDIQNYPGFTSINGMDLIRRIEKQVRNYSVNIMYDEVIKIEETYRDGKKLFKLRTVKGCEYETLSVILALGKTPKELNVPGEREFKGRGISYCVVCDAPLFRNKSTALISWGEHAELSITTLLNYVSKLYWIYPTEHAGTDDEFIRKVKESSRVEIYSNTEVVKFLGEKKLEKIVLMNRKTGRYFELQVDGVFIEVGYELKTEFLKDFIELNDNGEIVIDKLCRTSREGVFAAGDVTDIPYKQAIIAAAQGAVAALSACNYIYSVKGIGKKITRDWRKLQLQESYFKISI